MDQEKKLVKYVHPYRCYWCFAMQTVRSTSVVAILWLPVSHQISTVQNRTEICSLLPPLHPPIQNLLCDVI